MRGARSRSRRNAGPCAVVGLLVVVLGAVAVTPACWSGEAKKSSAQAAPLRGPQWPAGQASTYRLELSSSIRTGVIAPMMDLDFRGDLVLQAREVEGATQLAMVVKDAKVEGGGDEAAEQRSALARELREPFVFELKGGRVTYVFAPFERSHFALSILRTLAGSLQFAEQPDGAPSTWSAEEVDATGKYLANYERHGSGWTVEKRKVSYQTFMMGKVTVGQFNANLMPQVVDSKGQVDLRQDSGSARLERLTTQETIRVQLTATEPMTSRTSLTLEHRATRPAGSFDWEGALAVSQRIAAGENYVPKRVQPNYDAERIGDFTFDTALKELEAQGADPKSRDITAGEAEPAAALQRKEASLREQSEVFRAIVALLRVEPKSVERAKAKVLAGSAARGALLDALSSASTPESQAVLVGLMDDAKLDRKLRGAAAFALIRTPHATEDTIAALKAHLGRDFLHVHAVYGLGTIARLARERGDDRQANAILRTILEVLDRAQTPSEKIHALRGIANSGHPSALPAVKVYLQDDAPLVRAAAVDAMRLMKHPDVDGILAGQMRRGDEHVELAALDAVAVRESSPLLASALAYIAEHSTSTKSRLNAVQLMGQWLPRHPLLREALKRIAQRDERDAVRNAARRALEA